MIIRLTTIQVSNHWDAIKDMIVRAIPDIPGQLENRDNNILRSLLTAESVCWVGYKKVAEKQNDIMGMMITRIIFDDLTGIRSLLIYCLAGWDTMGRGFYKEGFDSLRKYGKEANCHRIIFYSDEQIVMNIAKELGFNIDIRFGVFQL